jgi:hypothetical protein
MAYHYYFAKWDDPNGYPGGHMMVYDPKTEILQDLGIPFPKSAIRVLQMDEARELLYAVTFPTGKFYSYDMKTGAVDFKGRVNNYDSVARLIVLDDEGNVYGSFAPYRLFKYDVKSDRLMDLPVILPHKQGPWCDRGHFHRENMWRNAVWHPTERVIYGMEMGSATLFRYDPGDNSIEDLGQLVISDFADNRIVPYTLHAFFLYPNGNLYYAAPSGSQEKACHFLRYDLESKEKTDLGSMVDPQYGIAVGPQGVAISGDGTVYFVGRVLKRGSTAEQRVMGLVILNSTDIQ